MDNSGLSHWPPHAAVVGLLLWALWAGDIDHLLYSQRADSRQQPANAGSAMLSADKGAELVVKSFIGYRDRRPCAVYSVCDDVV